MQFRRVMAVLALAIVTTISGGFPEILAGKPDGKGGGKGGGDNNEPPPYTYSIQWIGTGSGIGSMPRNVNEFGEVAGSLVAADGTGQAFIWSPTTGMMELNQVAPIPGFNLYGGQINDLGMVVGLAVEDGTGDNATYHFDPIRTSEPARILSGSTGSGFGLNNQGMVAYDTAIPGEVLIYDLITETTFPVTIPGALGVLEFNDRGGIGQILVSKDGGLSRFDASDGTSLELPDYTLAFGDFRCMNSFGDVCAEIPSGPGDTHVLWSDVEGETVILNKEHNSGIGGVNDFGEVCGTIARSGKTIYLYTDKTVWEINQLLPNGGDDKWKSARNIRARSINNQGDICGYASFWIDTPDGLLVRDEAFVLFRD